MIIFIPMKKYLCLGILCLLSLCARAGALEDIVPRPAEAELLKGHLRVSGISVRCDPAFGAVERDAVSSFAAQLGYVSGKVCPFSTPPGLEGAVASGKVKGLLFLRDASLGPEAYSIRVESGRALIRASARNGVLYALETLRQLLPPAICCIIPRKVALPYWVKMYCAKNETCAYSASLSFISR